MRRMTARSAVPACSTGLLAGNGGYGAGASARRDVGTVGDDPFGKPANTGNALFTDPVNEIGPAVSERRRSFADNKQPAETAICTPAPYVMLMTAVWGAKSPKS